jgi:hypothetical protein
MPWYSEVYLLYLIPAKGGQVGWFFQAAKEYAKFLHKKHLK